MDESFLNGISAWLERSGHAFELRVAAALRAGGARPVALSFTYIDPQSSVEREGDVLAQFGWTAVGDVPANLEVVVECKSGRDHPWVGFFDQRFARNRRLEDWTYFHHGPSGGVTEPLDNVWLGEPPFDFRQVASHLVAAHTGDGRNPANDAIRQVMSATKARKQRYLDRQAQDRRGCVIVPAVVTAARLVECRLTEDGSTALSEVDSMVVAAPGGGERDARVYVLSESAVERFASALTSLARRAGEEARFPH